MSEAETGVAFGLVLKYFGGDFSKAYVWWVTKNPALGDISPDDMLKFGRETKLLKWIKQQIADNEANETARRCHEKAVEG